MSEQTSLFLSQSYQDTWDDFQRSLTSEYFSCWDYVILTASNEHQAAIFRAQLAQRKTAGFLPDRTHFAVVPDEGGRRVGSGGATLGALRYVAQHIGRADFSGLRILTIHSGGDSKRVPQYSALGKLFSPVPRELPDGRTSTLFDELLIGMASVPGRIREGMLLLSGDVLLLFNPLQINFSGSGAAAISFKEAVSTGKDHGVFLRGESGNVRKFLHKQTEEELHRQGAVNERGKVDIDTGAVIFSADMLAALYGLISENGIFSGEKYAALVNETVRLSLYGDFLYPLAEDSTLEAFQKEKPEGTFCPELTAARIAVWNALRPYRMKLLRLAPAKFIHFGTTREIMNLMCGGIRAYELLGWKPQTGSSIQNETAAYGSVLTQGATVGEDCYLEVSYVHSKAVIGHRVVLSYVDIHDEKIPSDTVLHGLKQRDGRFVVRIYAPTDDPKAALANAAFLGKLLQQADAADIWDGDDRSLWTAKLYPVCDSIREAVAAALNLYELCHGRGDVNAWRQAQRKSLCAGFNDADGDALVAWDKRMQELVRMDRLAKLIRAKAPAREAKAVLNAASLTKIQQQWLEKRLQQADFSEAMRLHYYIGTALGGAEGARHIRECFRVIRGAVTHDLKYNENCKIQKDKHIVRLPLRVNFGGGWSDTPPYCLENGGTVLNAAILLDGALPVEVTLEKIPQKKIIFDSRDMDAHGEFDTVEALQSTGDPYDPFALQKAALIACGIIPVSGGELEKILTRLGGGILMRSEVTNVPKGSGLGTSSILAAACVKAIFEFMGIGYTHESLYSHVLGMEQIMATGGGWQDQVGGLTNGIKLITTQPGSAQKLRVEYVDISPETRQELDERFALIYTGQRRLARNLLRSVVGRYVGNEPEALCALTEIQSLALQMRTALESGDVDAFARLMNRHWALSRQLDAGSTNTLINQIFDSVADLTDGAMVCGAGGGGFLQVMLKKGVSGDEVHHRLKEIFQDTDVDIWNCTLIY
ncbi:MAG: bifunctional fucokinase/L-fucose-1-P-guanylyltransferase [Oscillospiraceae bacterium]|nr:bifunctional fucokinase/L-fucose-1-P-guanylyltransferase [Oscillospiraceae bacterium]